MRRSRYLEDSDDSDDGGGGFSYSDVFSFFANMTDGNGNDFDSQLVPAEDVPVSAVLSSLVFNSIAFLLLMGAYECLRRLLPTVYSSRKRLDRIHFADYSSSENFALSGAAAAGMDLSATTDEEAAVQEEEDAAAAAAASSFAGDVRCSNKSTGDNNNNNNRSSSPTTHYRAFPFNPDGNFGLARKNELRQSGLLPLPDDKPLDWVGPVFGVPWKKVRKIAGLDGYFFLRYIRMNVRITAVSTFWFFAVLVPIYATGGGPHQGQKYYQYYQYHNQQYNNQQQQQNNNGNNNYQNGGNNNNGGGEEPAYEDYLAATSSTATGWYYFSAANLPIHGWRM